MTQVTLAVAEASLQAWEAAAIAIERGRSFVVNNKTYGVAHKDYVAREVRAWRREVQRLALRAREDLEARWGGRRGGRGRRVVGVARRVR